jgi:hypothetical protein
VSVPVFSLVSVRRLFFCSVQAVIGHVPVMGIVELSGVRRRHPKCAACEFVERACHDGGW